MIFYSGSRRRMAVFRPSCYNESKFFLISGHRCAIIGFVEPGCAFVPRYVECVLLMQASFLLRSQIWIICAASYVQAR